MMKALILFIGLAIMTSFTAWSQTEENSDKKLSVSLSVGPSIPQGDFKQSIKNGNFLYEDIFYSKEGFAKTGYSVDLSVGYKVYNELGIKALFSLQSHNLDSNPIKEAINVASSLLDLDTGYWGILRLMGGVFYDIYVDGGEKITVEFKGLVGMTKGYSPEIVINISDNVFFVNSEQKRQNSKASFSYLLGTTFKYRLSNLISIAFNIDYFAVGGDGIRFDLLEYPKITTNDTDVDSTDLFDRKKFNKKVSSVNIGVGVIFNL